MRRRKKEAREGEQIGWKRKRTQERLRNKSKDHFRNDD